jgi:hypothetical protein
MIVNKDWYIYKKGDKLDIKLDKTVIDKGLKTGIFKIDKSEKKH